MKKSLRKLLLFVLASVLVLYPSSSAQAKVQSFESLYLEVTVPDDTIILTKDTPNSDELWNKAGITDPKTEKSNFAKMNVQALFYDPNTKSSVRMLKNQSKESSEAFNLSLLSANERKDFLANIFQPKDENTTYTTTEYQHPQIPFFNIRIEMTRDNVVSAEVIYGTVVNGYVVSYDIYEADATEPLDDSYLKQLVEGTHFTKFLDKAEVEKQGRQAFMLLVISTIIIVTMIILWIILSSRKKRKQAIIRKQKTKELSDFYQEQRSKDERNIKDPVLFQNHTLYSEEVIKNFCFYDATFHHIRRWVLTAITYILLLFSISASGYAMIGYILAAVLAFFMLYFQGLQIEKSVKQTMKGYEANKSMEAVFTFYEDYYTLSGLQTSSKNPYLQITEVKVYKDYIYLYQGSDRAQYLIKSGFGQEQEAFLRFIRQKTNLK